MRPDVRTAEKYLLTIEEAAAYFNIGEKRLINLLETPDGTDLMIHIGGRKRLVNRKKMEKYLDQIASL